MARRDLIGRPVAADHASVNDEESVYRWRARRLGLPFAPVVRLGYGAASDAEAIRRGVVARASGEDGTLYLAPDEETMPEFRRWLGIHPRSRPRIAIATRSAIRGALIEAGAAKFAASAIGRLERIDPDLSARRVTTLRQAAFAGVIVAAFAALLFYEPTITWLSINLIGGMFFFGVTLLRFIAAAQVPERTSRSRSFSHQSDRDLPTYTILVPLYREAGMVAELVGALDQIRWPADRLDIKLIVESDDLRTRQAVALAVRGAPYEIITVPSIGPRTKPKALDYALTFAHGSFVTIYDAEDRPHPSQLREAFAVFTRSGPELACLQAPIVVDNSEKSFIARLFAHEYSALFDGLLPGLATLGLPLPLGGTSNHFRREALEKLGGWDPYNVTEDADLGIRLARFGYRSEMLSLPTLEEAPVALAPWLRQRTRWFKGWLQTWLVHMRRPVRVIRAIGFRQFVGFSLVGAGMIVSALMHPVCLVTVATVVANPLLLWGDDSLAAAIGVGFNLFNLFAGYLAVIMLTRRTLAFRGRRLGVGAMFGLPLYWLMMSFACCWAIVELIRRPHHWQKTPHKGRSGAGLPRRLPAAPQRPVAAMRRRT